MEQVRAYLTELKLEQYVTKLSEEGFDSMDALRAVTEADLKAQGWKIGHIRLLLKTLAPPTASHGTPPVADSAPIAGDKKDATDKKKEEGDIKLTWRACDVFRKDLKDLGQDVEPSEIDFTLCPLGRRMANTETFSVLTQHGVEMKDGGRASHIFNAFIISSDGKSDATIITFASKQSAFFMRIHGNPMAQPIVPLDYTVEVIAYHNADGKKIEKTFQHLTDANVSIRCASDYQLGEIHMWTTQNCTGSRITKAVSFIPRNKIAATTPEQPSGTKGGFDAKSHVSIGDCAPRTAPSKSSRAIIFPSYPPHRAHRCDDLHGLDFSGAQNCLIGGQGGTRITWNIGQGSSDSTKIQVRFNVKAVAICLELGPNPNSATSEISYSVRAAVRGSPHLEKQSNSETCFIQAEPGHLLSEIQLWRENIDETRIIQGTLYLQ